MIPTKSRELFLQRLRCIVPKDPANIVSDCPLFTKLPLEISQMVYTHPLLARPGSSTLQASRRRDHFVE